LTKEAVSKLQFLEQVQALGNADMALVTGITGW
jgi:hypothetical protein